MAGTFKGIKHSVPAKAALEVDVTLSAQNGAAQTLGHKGHRSVAWFRIAVASVSRVAWRGLGLLFALVLLAMPASAQFGSSMQGTVTDASGAVIPGATITLRNDATQFTKKVESDASGVYRFLSLGPGRYSLSGTAGGFSATNATVLLTTNETRDLSLVLRAGSTSTTVNVSSELPLLNTAETRNQLTLDTKAFNNLPLPGRNVIGLIALAPGVSGLGSTADNFNTESANQVSANGRGANGNLYVIDGLDITSSVRPGVTNLTPNPDSISEVAIQTNTFSVEYGRASSIQTSVTTKSGTSHYHGFASDYFTNQKFQSLTHFVRSYRPYHSNNISAGIGGPIIPNHQAFFFFTIEPLRSLISNGNVVQFEDPAFTQFAGANFPNTLGTKLLISYPVANVSSTAIASTANDVFGADCGTAVTRFLPCSTPVIDRGLFVSSSFRNALQYSVRLDKNFKNDRLYGTVYRQHLDTGGPNQRPAFTTHNTSQTQAYQVNETHTFSPNTLNEASGAYLRVEGQNSLTGDFTVPSVSVSAISGFGVGFAQGDFIQTNYHWRDVFTHIVGTHSLRFGGDGVYYMGSALFATVHNQPSFNFNNILDLVQDNPRSEGQLTYDPVTGKPSPGSYGYKQQVNGFFAEDTWKATKNLTLTYGVRFDDFGNPSGDLGLRFANFFPGDGADSNQRVATGGFRVVSNAFQSRIKAISPRAGFALDPGGNGKTVLHGGFGVYHDSPTLGQAGDVFNGNPPNYVVPSFFSDGSTAVPIFALGTSKSTPTGFPYPAFVGKPLNAQGGIAGSQINVQGIQRNLKSSNTWNYVLTVDRQIASRLVASIGYVGSYSYNLVTGGGNVDNTIYGTDVNRFSGDLLQQTGTPSVANPGTFKYRTAPNRLNPSFGAIVYAQTLPHSNYSALVTSIKGRLTSRGFFNASYTYSRSMDNWQVYPTNDFSRYYSRSQWDIPNRVSAGYSYDFPGLHTNGLTTRMTEGFTLAGTTILQQGGRFSVSTNRPFQPTFDRTGKIIGVQPSSGDFNADGVNFDYPNVVNTNQKFDRKTYLSGIFPQSIAPNTGGCGLGAPFGTNGSQCGSFSQPALGTPGNETPNGFRLPGFAEWDMNLMKTTKITERVNFQIRLDVFNVFNRVNLNGVDGNANDGGNFGRSLAQFTPRNSDVGVRINF
jgi:hypothetical protein